MTLLHRLLPLLLILLLAGCAATRQRRSVETSGFLGDYSQFREGEGDEALLVYAKPGVDFSKYTKAIVDPVTIVTVEGSVMDDLSEEDRDALAEYLYWALWDNLSKDYDMVFDDGPGVLKVRAAITEAHGAAEVMNFMTTLVPQLRLLTTGISLAADTRTFAGAAAVEAEIVDAETGERLLAAVDARAGTRKFSNIATTWGHVKDAYDYWGERLHERLKELRELKGAPEPVDK